jgi:hypothetical protein
MRFLQHIVLNCTNRKRQGAIPGVQLRDIPPADVSIRAAAWVDAIANAQSIGPAESVYLGEYWQAGMGLARLVAAQGPVSVSVLSAGLGLVDAYDKIPAYAATFNRGHPDSVCADPAASPASVRRQWWDEIANWSGPGGDRKRRHLADLARRPGARLLVCVAPDYLDAAADDLRAAYKLLGDDRLVVVAAGEPEEGLSEVWVRCPGQLRMRLGGSMSSTALRATRAVIQSLDRLEALDANRARRTIADLLRSTEPLPKYERTRMTDSDVLAWIRTDAKVNPRANKSAALRRLRDQGRACEQARFGRLYDVVGRSQ